MRRARTKRAPAAALPASTKRRGRPRNAERHASILQATRDLILEVGYARVTIEAVAKRSGASRTTIYEWWGHRAPLVEEAIFADYGEWPVPDTGSFDGDLEKLVEEIVREMSRPQVALAFPALSAEFQADPALKAGLKERYGEPMAQRWDGVFKRATARGELAVDANAEAALQLTLGAVLMMTQSKILPRRALAPYIVSILSRGIVGELPGES